MSEHESQREAGGHDGENRDAESTAPSDQSQVAGDAGTAEKDERDELAREIEADPASNPEDPMLKEIKGG